MTDKLIEQMSDEMLLDQINAYDPYDVEFARRFWAQKARILADAEVIKAAEAFRADVIELLAYRAACDYGTADLNRISQHMTRVERSLDAFHRAMQGRKGGE